MVIEKTQEEKAFLKHIGGALKQERLKQDISQKQLAKRVGYIKPYSIYRIETGKTYSLDLTMIRRIAIELKIPLKTVLEI